MSGPEDPLPAIDFEADTRALLPPPSTPLAMPWRTIFLPRAPSRLLGTRTQVQSLSRHPSHHKVVAAPTPVTAPSPATTAPPSEVKQLFDLIVSKMAPLERKVARIANIVDGKTAGP
jgi:hypothetical protein